MDSGILDLVQRLGGIFLAIFYVAIVLWTYKDARRRIEDPILVATSVAASMLPIVGVFVYMLLRPPEYIADVRERELEIRAMERTLGRQERCPYCKSHIEGDYLSCPVCMTKLRQSCVGCEKPLDPRWVLCPFCETEVPRSQRELPRGGRGAGGGRENGRESGRDTGKDSGPRGAGTRTRTPSRTRREPAAPTSTRPAARPSQPTRDTDTRTGRNAESKPGRATEPKIDTEPFSSSRGPRFVRGTETPAAPGNPTMVTPAPGSTPADR